ncbi:helix-turn-helix domain-containing protein [uncultured Tateyamaria sp.]|uniref:helix-turn-helix domain-containing protein n=1 Tax=uncultured Tateyamaria sp. TaxID=455651 RepID=UPI0026194DB9|nr:helix-turn-helix domain-containing protein [uncultured Tateyamaria sp.]
MLDPVAFGALIKRKRGEARLTQETLAGDVFGDSTRKADISRIENGRVTPQEATIQKLCDALAISAAETEHIRQARPAAEQLANIPALSREELQNLGARFELEGAFSLPDDELRRLLTLKADEHRVLKAEVDSIDDRLKRLSNLKAAAQDAIARVDLDEVEELLSRVQEVELEEAAKTAELRANNALLRGRVNQAFRILCAAADSFGSVDPLEPARRRIQAANKAFPMLYDHGLRYGGDGLTKSAEIIQQVLTVDLREQDAKLWAVGQNNLALALQNKGNRTNGPQGATRLAEAVSAYRAALQVLTRSDYPVDWAITQNNLGIALRNQGIRTDGPRGAQLFSEAVDAYREALEICTRSDHPLDWAMTQNNLGITLGDQGNSTTGPTGAKLLAEAVHVFRAALEIYSRADHSVNWAMTQNNLGNALQNQAIRTDGPQGATLSTEAVAAYRAALEVRTREDHPVQWAMTQKNLSIALHSRASRIDASYPHTDLTSACAAANRALEVFDPEHMSFEYVETTRVRDAILADLEALSD